MEGSLLYRMFDDIGIDATVDLKDVAVDDIKKP